ncbi:hypothetical protein GYMLUDRAFT_59768 [Collybiopsis luxurians FD-317 M1]|uniref:Unplaced genomic scaffold GYMLUscaffold_29, whole genome shotgun sequence n=1 Tax=Collybiopsis luxurians FD-317 M1 TaxID=944289 RepID=A0A0D0B922_9AGAR|nr:hypothetical protein GYMLUDRAFT_59768 [Collybiopsis luxurians FD-317 M1]
MAVQWSSMYVMLHRAEKIREYISTFLHEKNIGKQKKLEKIEFNECRMGDGKNTQQAFLSENGPSLYIGLPAFKALHHAWSKQISKEKYSLFTDALQAGFNKLSDYYDWTGNSLAHVFAMILNPREKIIHFEKHWSSDLESKVQSLAEEITY